VPANQIVDLNPGDIFVHRNVANLFLHTDLGALSVLQYAVEVLKVRHIIVCGHYGCGGVIAAVRDKQFGLIDHWLRNIKDVVDVYRPKLELYLQSVTDQPQSPSGADGSSDPVQKMLDVVCELNAMKSLQNICQTNIVQNAWSRGQDLSVHGWCYRLADGLINDLDLCVSNEYELEGKIAQFLARRFPEKK
jgi:carbonic anhydrase